MAAEWIGRLISSSHGLRQQLQCTAKHFDDGGDDCFIYLTATRMGTPPPRQSFQWADQRGDCKTVPCTNNNNCGSIHSRLGNPIRAKSVWQISQTRGDSGLSLCIPKYFLAPSSHPFRALYTPFPPWPGELFFVNTADEKVVVDSVHPDALCIG